MPIIACDCCEFCVVPLLIEVEAHNCGTACEAVRIRRSGGHQSSQTHIAVVTTVWHGAGHPDFDIYSGESAAIVPRLVAGLAKRVVTAVAAAKHHTAAVTDGGEVWTWGSNRDGRLGYPAVDTQPTPRRQAASLHGELLHCCA